jgi:hypothetical protein
MFCRMSLLTFACLGYVLGQQANAPRLGANAPTLDYKKMEIIVTDSQCGTSTLVADKQ